MDPIVGVIQRNDLISLRSNPAGYIGDLVLPPLNVYQKSGSRNAASPVTGSTAQSGRSPGGAITNTGNLTSNLVSFTTAEILKRMLIDESERAMFGSDAEYEGVLAWTGSKQVRDAIETKVVTATANGSIGTNATGNIFGSILAVTQFLSAYGRVGLAGNASAFNQVRQDPTVIERMRATGVPLTTIQDVRSISSSQLAAVFTADMVVEAKTDTVIWPSNRIYAYVIADPSADPIGTIQVGRRLVYNFIGADGSNQTMTMEMLYDPSTRSNVLDTVVYDQAKVYNTIFANVISLDGN